MITQDDHGEIVMLEKLIAAAYSSGKVVLFFTIGLTIAAIVVMVMTSPASRKEMIVALLSTTMSSLCGGAALVMHFSLQYLAFSYYGLITLMGMSFMCGLPAWILVRAVFAWSEKNKTKGLPDLIRDIKGAIK